jgi:leucine dehydrogenase
MGQLLQYAGHEHVEVFEDPKSRLRCVIALHSTRLGPAAGGCRLWAYASVEGAVSDALRLSRGMSYKNAMAGLPLGGGKSVIMRPEGPFDRAALFRAFGDAVESLHGKYLTAEDVGTGIPDMEVVRSRTRYVAGLAPRPGRAGGDPSPWTALGVFNCMKLAVERRLGTGLDQVRVAIQGVGHVGLVLARLLHKEGARLVLADADHDRARGVAAELGALVLDPAAILGAEVDVMAPCALGGVLDERAINLLQATIVCGAANNQLATDADAEALRQRGILYAPDYVVNSGGIISVTAEFLNEDVGRVEQRLAKLPLRLGCIFDRAEDKGVSPATVADEMARELILNTKRVAHDTRVAS